MVVSAHMGLPYANQCDPHTGRPYDAASYAQPVYLCAPPPAPKPQAARTYCPPQFILQAYPYDAWYGSAPMMMPPPPPMPSWPPQPPAMPRVDAWGMYRAPVPAWPQPYAVPPQLSAYAGPAHPVHVPPPPAPLVTPVCPEQEPEAYDVVQSEVARPPVPLEKTAVVLSHFGAEAVWRTSAELVGLRRSATRSGARLSLHRETRSLSPESLPTDDCLSASSYSSHSMVEPVTPPNITPTLSEEAVSEPPLVSLPPSHDERSADLHRLVRAMGHMQQRPFPSLDQCTGRTGLPMSKSVTVALTPATTPSRRARISMKREHAALLGEVNPAFRHFTHQVLTQTLVSPMTLLLALHYIHMLQGTMWPDDGSGDTHAGLSLLAQPISTTPFKLLTLGLMMANKFLDDHTFLNKTWHEITGIPLDELNRMESFFLCRTQFHLAVSDSAWRQHLQAVRADMYAYEKQAGHEDSKMVSTLDQMLAAQVSGLCI